MSLSMDDFKFSATWNTLLGVFKIVVLLNFFELVAATTIQSKTCNDVAASVLPAWIHQLY